MFANFPSLLRQAVYGLAVGMLGLAGVLWVSKPIPYIATMTLGGLGLAYCVVCYLRFFLKEIRSPDANP